MSEPGSYTHTEIVARTHAWVRETFRQVRPDGILGDDDPLLGSGVIDSIGVVKLVEFLEGTFGFKVADEEMAEQNLGSLNAIGRFVLAKCRGTGAAGTAREGAGAGVLLRPRA